MTYTKEEYEADMDAIDVPDGFEHYLEAWDNDSLPDGAWWAYLEEGVASYNEDNGTSIDGNDGVHVYLKRKNAAKEQ